MEGFPGLKWTNRWLMPIDANASLKTHQSATSTTLDAMKKAKKKKTRTPTYSRNADTERALKSCLPENSHSSCLGDIDVAVKSCITSKHPH